MEVADGGTEGLRVALSFEPDIVIAHWDTTAAAGPVDAPTVLCGSGPSVGLRHCAPIRPVMARVRSVKTTASGGRSASTSEIRSAATAH